MSEIRVRFAPSPTGYLHVGGARTAIFNWLFAKNVGGKFLLRIEDTDPVRSRGELAQVILDGLKWLGIESDETVVYQSDNKNRFLKIAHELVSRGHAYCDFTTPQELEQMRTESQNLKQPAFLFKADLDKVRAETPARLAKGDPYAIRFSAPREGLAWTDLVHGSISFKGEDLDDFVLVRSDGSPTYHLSVVCDDHDMNITHVLRGDDHISNTPKQIGIYLAMNWPLPEFGHVPLILGQDKKRLSKRLGATAVGEFQEKGYLPDALFNFLTLLGWSPGAGDREIFKVNELINIFAVKGIQSKSAVFDEAKLEWMNGEHLRKMDESAIADYLFSYNKELVKDREYLLKLLPLILPRIRVAADLNAEFSYLFIDPQEFDPVGVNKQFSDFELLKKLRLFRDNLVELVPFDANIIEQELRSRCESWNLSAGKLIHPLRLALTGKTVSPGLFEMMAAFGKDTVIRRIDFALRKFVVEVL